MVRVRESSPVSGEKCTVGSICGKGKFSAWSERVKERQKMRVLVIKIINWRE